MRRRKRTAENELNFRNHVRSRDNWTCQKCGSTEYPQAHHIDSAKDYPLFQNLLDNGITLCVYCHADAHPEVPRGLFISQVIRAEKEGCISAGKLAKELNVNPRTIVRKAIKLGILKPMQKWMFTQEEADSLRRTRSAFEGVYVHLMLDRDQYEYLAKLVEKRRSTFSQVVREMLQDVMKEVKR